MMEQPQDLSFESSLRDLEMRMKCIAQRQNNHDRILVKDFMISSTQLFMIHVSVGLLYDYEV